MCWLLRVCDPVIIEWVCRTSVWWKSFRTKRERKLNYEALDVAACTCYLSMGLSPSTVHRPHQHGFRMRYITTSSLHTTIYSWHWWIAGIKLNYGNLLIEIRWLLNFRLLSEVRQWSFVSYLNPVLLRISTLWGFYVIHECSLKWFHSEVMAFLIQSFDEQAFVSTLWEDCWAISSIES